VTLSRLIEAISTAPARLLGLEAGTLAPGAPADIIVVDLDMPWIVKKDELRSRSRNSAFEDARMTGKVLRTMVGGRTVYEYVH
jgi:dihydroorotase